MNHPLFKIVLEQKSYSGKELNNGSDDLALSFVFILLLLWICSVVPCADSVHDSPPAKIWPEHVIFPISLNLHSYPPCTYICTLVQNAVSCCKWWKNPIAITFQIKKLNTTNNKHNFYSKLGFSYKVQKKRNKNCKFNFVFFMGVHCSVPICYF